MKEYYFTFRSVTRAMEAEKRLKQVGLVPTLLRTPAPLREKGCGYTLRVRSSEWEPVRQILTTYGYERLFVRNGNAWEEVGRDVF